MKTLLNKSTRLGPWLAFFTALTATILIYALFWLPQRGFYPPDRGWIVSYETDGDREYRVEETTIEKWHLQWNFHITTSVQFLDIFIDDELVYSYQGDKNGRPYRGYYSFPMQTEYIGKNIRLVMSSPQEKVNHLMGSTPSMQYFGQPTPAISYFLQFLLLLAGLSSLVLAFIWWTSGMEGKELFLLGGYVVLYTIYELSATEFFMSNLSPQLLYLTYWGGFFSYPSLLLAFVYVSAPPKGRRWVLPFAIFPSIYALITFILDIFLIAPIGITEFWYNYVAISCFVLLLLFYLRAGHIAEKIFSPLGIFLFSILLLWGVSLSIRWRSGAAYDISVEYRHIARICILFLTVYELVLYTNRLTKLRYDEQSIRMRSEHIMKSHQVMATQLRESAHLRHELKHHFTALCHLYEGERFQELGEYLHRSGAPYLNLTKVVHSENFLLQAILNNAAEQARELGFTIDSSISVAENLPVNETDMTSILLNLLENALEACKTVIETEKRFILVRIKHENHLFFISVENSYDGNIQYNGKRYYSTKAGTHCGHGLRIVKDICKRYHGIFETEHVNNTFRVRIVLNT